MFDWQASGDDLAARGVVSSNFWVYWVVAAPLTAAILVGWRFWWKHQKRHYTAEYLEPQQSVVAEKRAQMKEV